jgi:hypothetical protein
MVMAEADQRAIAETFFEGGQSRHQIKEALRLEDERRAALVKNLYRLRALRLSGEGSGQPKPADSPA